MRDDKVVENIICDKIRSLEGNSYGIIRNAYIPYKKGKYTEVDVILVHDRGLFVFESKNYSGIIKGSSKDTNWVQELGNSKTEFYNPILQNNTHIKAIRRYLKRYSLPVYSIIVFSNFCDISKLELGEYDFVMHVSDITTNLNTLIERYRYCMRDNDKTYVVDKLKECTEVSEKVINRHKRRVDFIRNLHNKDGVSENIV